MQFNGTFLATILTFIVFVFLMNKILYAPILGIMNERQKFIDDNYKNAKDNDNKTETLTSEKEEKLVEAKNDARNKYLDLLNKFKAKKSEIITEAQNAATKKLEKSSEDLEAVSNDVKNGLKSKMTDLANDIVEKVLGYRSDIQGFDDEKVNEVLYH